MERSAFGHRPAPTLSRAQFRAHSAVTAGTLVDNFVAQKETAAYVSPNLQKNYRKPPAHRRAPQIAGTPPIDAATWWKLYVLGTNMRSCNTLQQSFRKKAWVESVRNAPQKGSPHIDVSWRAPPPPPHRRAVNETFAIAERYRKKEKQMSMNSAMRSDVPMTRDAAPATSPETTDVQRVQPHNIAASYAPASAPSLRQKSTHQLAAEAGCTEQEYLEFYGTNGRGSPIRQHHHHV